MRSPDGRTPCRLYVLQSPVVLNHSAVCVSKDWRVNMVREQKGNKNTEETVHTHTMFVWESVIQSCRSCQEQQRRHLLSTYRRSDSRGHQCVSALCSVLQLEPAKHAATLQLGRLLLHGMSSVSLLQLCIMFNPTTVPLVHTAVATSSYAWPGSGWMCVQWHTHPPTLSSSLRSVWQGLGACHFCWVKTFNSLVLRFGALPFSTL